MTIALPFVAAGPDSAAAHHAYPAPGHLHPTPRRAGKMESTVDARRLATWTILLVGVAGLAWGARLALDGAPAPIPAPPATRVRAVGALGASLWLPASSTASSRRLSPRPVLWTPEGGSGGTRAENLRPKRWTPPRLEVASRP